MGRSYLNETWESQAALNRHMATPHFERLKKTGGELAIASTRTLRGQSRKRDSAPAAAARFYGSHQKGDIMKVGFIGLGSMGAGMSPNLIKAGHDLVVYNRTRSLAQEMRSLGARAADSASEATVGAEALITMLADDCTVQDVIFEQVDRRRHII
jgi:glutamyl-tRNA reductase